jgi:hypothetical protein
VTDKQWRCPCLYCRTKRQQEEAESPRGKLKAKLAKLDALLAERQAGKR